MLTCTIARRKVSALIENIHRSNLAHNRILERLLRPVKFFQYTKLMSSNDAKLGSFRSRLTLPCSTRIAFTLSEVLITLGIIGVLAAMTIPALIQKQQEQQTVVALKKTYSTLSNAYTFAVQENGTPEYWGITDYSDGSGAKIFLDTLLQNAKVLKNCGNVPYSKCFPNEQYKSRTGTGYHTFENYEDQARAILADGSLISTWTTNTCSPTCSLNNGGAKNVCATIVVDINGAKKPNRFATDTFTFYITKNGVVPAGMNGDTNNALYNGNGSTAWVIYNENMDYLHCDDLSWTGKHECS